MTLPETAAAERVAEMIGRHLYPPWLTEGCLIEIATKVVAHRAAVIGVFADLDGNPRRLGAQAEVQLRQHRPVGMSDAEWLDEEIHSLLEELFDKREMRARIGEVAEFDPDERDQDREDDRAREARQDESAKPGPQV